MKRMLYLLVTMMFLFQSCSKDDAPVAEEIGIIQISVFYTVKGATNTPIPDVHSKVYIYSGKFSSEFDLLKYSFDEGRLVNGEEVILPDQCGEVGADGMLTMRLEHLDESFLQIIESHYYKRQTADYYPYQQNVNLTVTFNP